MEWLELKGTVVDAFGISRDALHLLIGFFLQALLVLIARSWFGAFWPVALVALAALGNEWLDLTNEIWPGELRTLQWWESGKDMVTSLAIPVTLLLLCRLAPERFDRPARPASAPELDPEPELALSE